MKRAIIRYLTGMTAVLSVVVLLGIYYVGVTGCGSSATVADDTTTEDAAAATENNASRALETNVLTISTTVPSN